jgi:hypothetical protein
LKRAASLTLAVLLLAVGCSDTVPQVPPAGLGETYDVAFASDLIFVTSAETDDLRVIDPSITDYVRAPNPLEALSVPVVPRPDKLARDVSYEAPGRNAGDEVTGPYVYVRSANLPAISVVYSRDASNLREVYRVQTAGSVTAFAARGPTTAQADASVLYFTTQEGGASRLWQVTLPADPAALAVAAPQPVELAISPLPAGGFGPANALAVLPDEQLAMATRKFQGTSTDPAAPQRPAAAVRLKVGAGSATVEAPLVFTIPTGEDPTVRAPVAVRSLMTHGRVTTRTADATPLRAAGQLIFGIIDEESCGSLPRCNGVLAVDSASGAIAMSRTPGREAAGTVPAVPEKLLPMIPLSFDASLPTGLTLTVGGEIVFAQGTSNVLTPQPMLGVLAHASGRYLFFDAERLIHFETNAALSTATFSGLLTASNAVKTGPVFDFNPVVMVAGEGYSETEQINVIFEGPITAGAFDVGPADAAERLVVDADLFEDIQVEADPRFSDLVQIFASATETQPCAELPILEKSAGASGVSLRVGADFKFVPEACPATGGLFRLLARGTGPRPFVVFSDLSGFLGRLGQADPIVLSSAPRFYTTDFAPAKRLSISLKSNAHPLTVRGDRYVYSVVANFDPFDFLIATEVPGLERFFIPGQIAFSPGKLVEENGEQVAKGQNRIYVVYPTADGLLQILLDDVNNNARVARTVVPFR